MPATPRQHQAEARRLQFLEAALSLFATQGVEATTIKDVAEATSTAPGLLYHYFHSKEELLAAVLDTYSFLPELRVLLGQQHAEPVQEVLLGIARDFFALLDAHAAFVQVFFHEAQTNRLIAAQLAEMIHEAVTLVSDDLAARIRAGEVRPHATEASARMFLYTVFLHHLTHGAAEPFLNDAIAVLVQGILA